MEQIEKYLDEIEAALYKMSPTEREHLMEVLHLAFADYFENNYRRSQKGIRMKEKWIREIQSKTKGNGYKVEAKVREDNILRSINGGRFYVADYDGDKKLAKMAAIDARNKLQKEIEIDKYSLNQMTVEDCYLKSLRDRQASIKTKQRHDSMFKAMIPDSLKKKDILKVTTSDVQSSINAYCLNHTQAQMNHAMCIWRQIYKAALTAEIPVIDRSQMVIVPKSKIVRKKKDNSITYEQFLLFEDELLKYNCASETGRHRSAAIWYACQIMLYTGLRPQEVYALSKSDIDLESMQISINKSVGSTSTLERQIVPVKTIYSDAIVPISSSLKPILEQMLKWTKHDDLVLADLDGQPFDIDLVCTLIVNVSHKCKSKYGFTFNQYKLRHLFSKDLFEANVNPKVIQALMRHANENMSLYYAYTTDEDKAKAIENRKL